MVLRETACGNSNNTARPKHTDTSDDDPPSGIAVSPLLLLLLCAPPRLPSPHERVESVQTHTLSFFLFFSPPPTGGWHSTERGGKERPKKPKTNVASAAGHARRRPRRLPSRLDEVPRVGHGERERVHRDAVDRVRVDHVERRLPRVAVHARGAGRALDERREVGRVERLRVGHEAVPAVLEVGVQRAPVVDPARRRDRPGRRDVRLEEMDLAVEHVLRARVSARDPRRRTGSIERAACCAQCDG